MQQMQMQQMQQMQMQQMEAEQFAAEQAAGQQQQQEMQEEEEEGKTPRCQKAALAMGMKAWFDAASSIARRFCNLPFVG